MNEGAVALSEKLGRYHLLEELGHGGMGSVVLARADGARGFERHVVIKRMLPALLGRPDATRRFVDEALLMSRMPHPHIAQVLDLIEDEGGVLHLVMEHVEGVSLAEARASVPPPTSLAAYIIARVADGLHFAHELRAPDTGLPLGVVHRDVTPQNVLLSRYGDVKLTDFGVAFSRGKEEATKSGLIVGKLPYLSPEQARDHDLDRRSDVFALAITLYELLCGRRPFLGRGHDVVRAILQDEPPPPSALERSVPRELDDIVMRALAKDVHARTTSAAAFARQLDSWLADTRARAGGAEVARYVEVALASGGAGETVSGARPIRAATETTAPHTSKERTPTSRHDVDRPLPRRTSSFVGRENTLARLQVLFDEGRRVVTLLGPGGMGKTRTALAFAQRFAGRALFCDLSEATSLGALCRAVGDGLSVPLAADDDPVAQIGAALEARAPALVVLDNFEQVVQLAGSTVAAWSALREDLLFLVTSRERLRIDGEHVVELPPLTLPGAGKQAHEAEAVRLFVDRAGSHGVAVGAHELDDVTSLVALLEGVPLAIELAAAATPLFTPRELKRRLRKSLDALEVQSGDVSDRHRGLKRTLAWSWQLLSDAERLALAQCSVFRGGFTLDAARDVVDLSGIEGAPEVWSVIARLLDKSLLFREPDARGERRFGMYLAVRAFAGEQRAALEPGGGSFHRHERHFLQQGESLAAAVDEHEGSFALERLRSERSNLLALHRRALRARPPTTMSVTSALHAAAALAPAMSAGGPLDAWLELLDATLALVVDPAPDGALSSEVFEARALSRYDAGLFDGAVDDARHAAELASGNRRRRARALRQLGFLLLEQGELEEAEAVLEEALAHARAVDDGLTQGIGTANLGMIAWARRDLDAARDQLSAGLALLEQVGSSRLIGLVRGMIGAVLVEQGACDDADVVFARAVREIRAGGYHRYAVVFLAGRGLLRLRRGEPEPARRYFERAREAARRLGERRLGVFTSSLVATCRALAGEREAAEAGFARASSEVTVAADAFTVALLQGSLDLLLAEDARARGASDEAEQHLFDVRSKIETTRALLEARVQGQAAALGVDTMSASLLTTTVRLLQRRLDDAKRGEPAALAENDA